MPTIPSGRLLINLAVATPVKNTCAKGNNGGIWLQKGYTRGRNDSGNFQGYHFKGSDVDVDAFESYFLSQGWDYTITRLGGNISEIVARAGWNPGTAYSYEYLDDIWEFSPESTDKPLLSADFPNSPLISVTGGYIGQTALSLDIHAGAISGVPTGSAATRKAIQAALNDQNPVWKPPGDNFGQLDLASGVKYYFDDGTTGGYSSEVIALCQADYDAAYSLYKLMASGFEQFPVDAPVIKHTQLFSNLYSTLVTFSNVGRIIGNASMVSIEGFPTGGISGGGIYNPVLFGLPNAPTPGQFIETSGDLVYGWKKSMPEVTRMAMWKWRSTQHYQFGLWPIRAFGAQL